MSFEYKKSKGHDNESFWTSYSDLFLGLSSIFLMLYVVASLRSGTDSIKLMNDNQKLQVEVQDLKNQLQTYEAVKDGYMAKEATKNEVNEYNELMDKLSLLKEEAKNEKNELRKAALQNEQKEVALNKYQQMVRNVINASNMAKVKVINRNEVINLQDQDISAKATTITNLNSDISRMNQTIKSKEQEISNVNTQLSKKMNELKTSLKKSKMSQAAYNAKIKALKDQAHRSVTALQNEKQQMTQNLYATQRQLSATQNQLNETSGQLDKTRGEVSGLQQQIGNLNAETQAKIAGLRQGFAAEQARARGEFEAALKNQKNLSGAEIARREAEFKRRGEARERQIASEIAGLSNQLKNTEGQLAAANAELAARKGIAEEIKKGFKGAGVKAEVDGETGDVVLDFGQAYFESNSADLKNEMRKVLQKAMPVYSKSLFGNPKVSQKISAVEVIGFASPTYQGRVIDPMSTKVQDREAIKYNMDLSYRRAKSIFNYLLDGKEMNFDYHQNLVPSLKVSGRSFLDLMKTDRSIASAEDYCRKYDCKKSQRVIIRFNMDNKK